MCGREDHEDQFKLQQQATTDNAIDLQTGKLIKKIALVFNRASCYTDLKMS